MLLSVTAIGFVDGFHQNSNPTISFDVGIIERNKDGFAKGKLMNMMKCSVQFNSVQFGLCVYVAVYLNTKSNKPEAMKIQKENRHVESALCNRLHYARFNL